MVSSSGCDKFPPELKVEQLATLLLCPLEMDQEGKKEGSCRQFRELGENFDPVPTPLLYGSSFGVPVPDVDAPLASKDLFGAFSTNFSQASGPPLFEGKLELMTVG